MTKWCLRLSFALMTAACSASTASPPSGGAAPPVGTGSPVPASTGASSDGGTSAPCTPVQTLVAQINAGGGAAGGFAADRDSTGGSVYGVTGAIDLTGVTNPAPLSVYQSYRYGFKQAFRYAFTGLGAGQALFLRLHFADLVDTAPGQRTFNVTANGAALLTNFDVIATAGGPNRALVEERTVSADGSGGLALAFTPNASSDPSSIVNGIELFKVVSSCGGADAGPTDDASPSTDGAPAPSADDASPAADAAPSTDAAPIESDGGVYTYAQIMAGIRPRGQQCASYALLAPTGGGTAYYVDPSGNDGNAGSQGSPFATIQKAATVARAGDVVTINSGAYNESVTVANAGTASAPIVFQAAQCGGPVLGGTNNQTFTGASSSCGAQYVTVRGLVFRKYATQDITGGQCQPSGAAVDACGNWTIDDCLFDHPGSVGVRAYANGITVTRTTIEYANGWSILGAGASMTNLISGLTVKDSVFHHGNYQGQAQASCSSSLKVLQSTGTTVENIESYSNEGPSWWFDWANYNWVVTNNYFHDNTGDTSSDSWAGVGFWAEGPGGGGVLAYNVITGMPGGGIGFLETQGHTAHHNYIYGGGIQMRYGCHGSYLASGLTFHDNEIHGGNIGGDYVCSGGAAPGATPAANMITGNDDVFDDNGSSIWHWGSQNPTSPAQAFSQLGVEQGGSLAPVPWPPQ